MTFRFKSITSRLFRAKTSTNFGTYLERADAGVRLSVPQASLQAIQTTDGTKLDPKRMTFPASLQPFNKTAMSRLEGRSVVRSAQQLRLHPALNDLAWITVIDEINDAAIRPDQSVPEPILITTNGTILTGFGRWQLAIFDSGSEINCIEYPLSEDDSLQFIIRHHQPQPRWNAFIRINLALKLESRFQQGALDNMRAGGKYKGSANLPEAQRIDVREDVARVAGVSSRNVSNVKMILHSAHPRLIDALAHGTLRIHRALQWCRLPRPKQLEQFTRYTWERTKNKVIHQTIARPKTDQTGLDPVTLLDALQRQETRQPGSLVLRISRTRGTTVLVGQDVLTDLHSQRRVAQL